MKTTTTARIKRGEHKEGKKRRSENKKGQKGVSTVAGQGEHGQMAWHMKAHETLTCNGEPFFKIPLCESYNCTRIFSMFSNDADAIFLALLWFNHRSKKCM
jgi:hypothetical protein